MNTIAIIPARRGSKRVSRKNLLEIGDVSLIERAIDSVRIPEINSIHVLSDDLDVLTIADNEGAYCTWLPRNLTDPISSLDSVVQYFLERHSKPDVFVLTQPTSPFRTRQHVSEALQLFDLMQPDSVVSVSIVPMNPDKLLKLDYQINTLNGRSYSQLPTQASAGSYLPNGAIFITNTDWFTRTRRFLTDTVIPYWMSEWESIQIDTDYDVAIAQFWAENFVVAES